MTWFVRVGIAAWVLFAVTLTWLPSELPLARARGKGTATSRRPPRLKLWDRVLYDRWRKADNLTVQAEKLLARKQYDGAAALLRQAIRIRPYAASLWFALGTMHSLAGRYAKCVQSLERARRLGPKFRANLVAFRMGLCLSLSGRIAEGTREYQKVKPGRWVKASIRNWNLADNYMALGRLTEAVAHYRLALRYHPGQRVLHFALAVALDRQGRPRAAERRMKRALQLDPKASALSSKDIIWLPSHDHHYYRALRFFVGGQRAAALDHWQRFHQSAPRSPWRWVIRRRLDELRRRAFAPNEVRVLQGKVLREAAATRLTAPAPALRACLGRVSAQATVADFRGARLQITVKGGRLQELRLVKRVGGVPATAPACLRKALRRVAWRKIASGSTPASFTLDLVGP